MRTQAEIHSQIDMANEKEESGSGFNGMNYEDGVRAALEWILGGTDSKPMDD